jgi:hypothetical protein
LNVEEAEKRLRDYLLNGLATEIFWADQAYALAEEIGRHAEQVNAANFGELFGWLQLALSDRHTLAIVKIFDPAKQYPTRSIPGTLNLLDSNAELWRVRERRRLHQVLIEAGVDRGRFRQFTCGRYEHRWIPTWGEANSLAKYAKEFVATVGTGYLGLIIGKGSDDYRLTDASRRTSLALRRLLKAAGIAADKRG